MPYGQFTAYEPAGQPGAYNFALANGNAVTLFGPEAEDLRAKIDASNAAMPQPTAQNMSTADQNMSVPDAQGGPNMSVGTPQPGPPAPTQIPETTVEAAPPAPAPQNVGFGLVRTPDGQLAQYRPGSGGVSKAALEQKSTQGTAIPVSQSETVRGGFDPSQDYLEGMADVSIAERQNAEQRTQRDMLVAEQAAQAARDQEVAIAAQAAEAQRQALAAEIRVNRDQQIKDAAFKDYAEARVDPHRLFRGEGGTARAIGAAISAGLGAFGSAITKTPNFAMQLIEGAIERDIRGQEAEIAVKKQAADNALADLTKSGLTMEQSKGLLRQLQKEYAAKQAATIVAGNQIPEVMQRYQEWSTEHQKQRLQFEESYRQQSLGEATKAVASTVAYPQAGTRGGYAPMTPERQLALAKGMKDLRAPAGGEHSAREAAKLDAAEGSVEVINRSLEKYDPNAVPETTDTQNVVTRAWRGLKDFIGGEGTSGGDLSPQDRAMIQDVETAKQQIMSIGSVLSEQGALSEPERQAAERAIQSARTVGEVRRAAAGLADRVRGIRQVKER